MQIRYSPNVMHGRATGVCLSQGMVKVEGPQFRACHKTGLPKQYTKCKIGEIIVLKESWQPIDHAGIEAKALGTRNQFGVGDVIGSSKTECDTGEIQSTSLLPGKVDGRLFVANICEEDRGHS